MSPTIPPTAADAGMNAKQANIVQMANARIKQQQVLYTLIVAAVSYIPTTIHIIAVDAAMIAEATNIVNPVSVCQ